MKASTAAFGAAVYRRAKSTTSTYAGSLRSGSAATSLSNPGTPRMMLSALETYFRVFLNLAAGTCFLVMTSSWRCFAMSSVPPVAVVDRLR